jgi:adenylosuccinate synthase
MIDPRCPIITAEHRQREQASEHLRQAIGSTASGSGVCQADFALRRVQQARQIAELQPLLGDVAAHTNELARQGSVIVECSQGTLLSVALSPDHPYVTSGNCTVAAAADDIGLNWQRIGGAMMMVKAVPSRVGAGQLPGELDPAEIAARGIAEYGVVTGRLRRKAGEIPWDLLGYAAMLNGPTEIALTFCDHYDSAVTEATMLAELTPPIERLIAQVEATCNAPVTIIETGKPFRAMIDRR